MNQGKRIGFDDETLLRVLHFNDCLKCGVVTGAVRTVAIDFYCDYLYVMHPECNLIK